MKITIRKIWRKKQFINKFQAVSKEWIHTQERDVSVNTLTEAKKSQAEKSERELQNCADKLSNYRRC